MPAQVKPVLGVRKHFTEEMPPQKSLKRQMSPADDRENISEKAACLKARRGRRRAAFEQLTQGQESQCLPSGWERNKEGGWQGSRPQASRFFQTT